MSQLVNIRCTVMAREFDRVILSKFGSSLSMFVNRHCGKTNKQFYLIIILCGDFVSIIAVYIDDYPKSKLTPCAKGKSEE